MILDREKNTEKKLFEGIVIYFSGSMQGILNTDPYFSYNLVQFMIENGAKVLDVHVAGRTDEERRKLFIQDNGFDPAEQEDPCGSVEEVDIRQVDESTHVIALTNGASYGVGNEVQRAIDNYEMRGRRTEILCLVQEERLDPLSWMIRGKEKPKYPNFHVNTYTDFEDAKRKVTNFLTTSYK